MYNNYGNFHDITSRIDEKPKWWYGDIPRYDNFDLNMVQWSSSEVMLIHGCDQVESADYFVAIDHQPSSDIPLSQMLLEGKFISIGDPPSNLKCRNGFCSGIPLKIVEFWQNSGRPHKKKWVRKPEYELFFDEGWLYFPYKGADKPQRYWK